MNDLKSCFSKEYLSRLETLSLSLRERLGVNGYIGARKSSAKGNSLEFSDFREYTAGDDLRRVDWNSYSRFKKVYLKLYTEEKQASVSVFMDCSRSMAEEKKFLQAKAIGASVSYLALCGQDRLELFAYAEGAPHAAPATMHKNQFLQQLEFLEGLSAQGKTDLIGALRQCRKFRRGITFLISDFLAEQNWEEAIQFLQYQKQEVFLIQVLSKQDISPSFNGMIRLIDSETKEARDLEIDAAALQAYEKALREHRLMLQEICRRRGASFFCVTEDEPLLQCMKQILWTR